MRIVDGQNCDAGEENVSVRVRFWNATERVVDILKVYDGHQWYKVETVNPDEHSTVYANFDDVWMFADQTTGARMSAVGWGTIFCLQKNDPRVDNIIKYNPEGDVPLVVTLCVSVLPLRTCCLEMICKRIKTRSQVRELDLAHNVLLEVERTYDYIASLNPEPSPPPTPTQQSCDEDANKIFSSAENVDNSGEAPTTPSESNEEQQRFILEQIKQLLQSIIDGNISIVDAIGITKSVNPEPSTSSTDEQPPSETCAEDQTETLVNDDDSDSDQGIFLELCRVSEEVETSPRLQKKSARIRFKNQLNSDKTAIAGAS